MSEHAGYITPIGAPKTADPPQEHTMRVSHVLALGPATAEISRSGRLYVVTYSATVRERPRAERFATAYRTRREAERAKAQADHIELMAFGSYLNRVDRVRAYLARRVDRASAEAQQLAMFA